MSSVDHQYGASTGAYLPRQPSSLSINSAAIPGTSTPSDIHSRRQPRAFKSYRLQGEYVTKLPPVTFTELTFHQIRATMGRRQEDEQDQDWQLDCLGLHYHRTVR
jgi:hypothetical protein